MTARSEEDPRCARLRRRLARLDRALLATLRDRERTQWQLLARKERLGLPLTDLAQEARVRERANVWAEGLGVDPALAEAVVLAALHAGKARYSRRASLPRHPVPGLPLPRGDPG